MTHRCLFIGGPRDGGTLEVHLPADMLPDRIIFPVKDVAVQDLESRKPVCTEPVACWRYELQAINVGKELVPVYVVADLGPRRGRERFFQIINERT